MRTIQMRNLRVAMAQWRIISREVWTTPTNLRVQLARRTLDCATVVERDEGAGGLSRCHVDV